MEQQKDPDIARICRWVATKTLPGRCPTGSSRTLQSLLLQKDQLMVKDGILLRRRMANAEHKADHQLVVPQTLRQDILQCLHSGPEGGHLGKKKTLWKIRQRFYWPDLSEDVADWCRKCPECNQRKSGNKHHRGQLEPQIAPYPMSRIGVDIIGPFQRTERGNKYILTVQDYFSKWPEAYPIPDMTASTVARTLVNEFICRYGAPESLHTNSVKVTQVWRWYLNIKCDFIWYGRRKSKIVCVGVIAIYIHISGLAIKCTTLMVCNEQGTEQRYTRNGRKIKPVVTTIGTRPRLVESNRDSNKESFHASTKDNRSFLGLLLLSGYHCLADAKYHLTVEPDLTVDAASKTMSRNRFHQLKRFLHFSDNQNLSSDDEMSKVSPLYQMLNDRQYAAASVLLVYNFWPVCNLVKSGGYSWLWSSYPTSAGFYICCYRHAATGFSRICFVHFCQGFCNIQRELH
ncbi:Retrovirus-related Pol polyprotein from transposon [Trichinella britovi]|uniref:RNA-directed DNA polymerase n=1 Tax=Trichinella britovi TaxID=45882 RepID=A0A0V1CMT8_TRIBR|nr:Retrovirus-related Pol polyprotein from transposon [Trichinella britovi]